MADGPAYVTAGTDATRHSRGICGVGRCDPKAERWDSALRLSDSVMVVAEGFPTGNIGNIGNISNIGNIGVTPLAETGMVTVSVADGADVVPMDDEDVDIRGDNPISTEIWCRRGTSIRNDLHDQLVVTR